MISSFKKIIFFCFLFVSLSSQDQVYMGDLSFSYNGTTSNYFSSMMGDSMRTTIAYNQDNGDSSYFLFASITQQDSNEFDLFLTFRSSLRSKVLKFFVSSKNPPTLYHKCSCPLSKYFFVIRESYSL